MKRLFSIWILFALAAVVSAAEQLNVVATLPDLAAVASAVGGSAVKLTALAQPTEDPHFVDPKPSFARVLNKADALIEGGASLEAGWLQPLVEGARNPKILPGKPGRIVASAGIALKEIPAAADRSQGDVHPTGNPHFMMDPANAALFAKTLAEKLGQLQPAQAATFKASAEKFAAALKEAEPGWAKQLAPAKGAKVITYHRTFTYFLDRYGLELFDTIEPKPGIEPSPSHITALIKNAKGAGVKAILIEGNRSRKTPDRIASEIGAKVVVLEQMPSGDYVKWMNGMADAVAKGFAAP